MLKKRAAYKPKQLPVAGLPNRLRRCRLAKNMSIRAIANHLGVSPQAVHKAETTGEGLNKQKWYMLADLFECDPRHLESPEPKEDNSKQFAIIST